MATGFDRRYLAVLAVNLVATSAVILMVLCDWLLPHIGLATLVPGLVKLSMLPVAATDMYLVVSGAPPTTCIYR